MKKILSIAAMMLFCIFANAQYEINFAKYATSNLELGESLESSQLDFNKSMKIGRTDLYNISAPKEEFAKDFAVKGNDWMLRFKDGKAIGLYPSHPGDDRLLAFQNVKAGQTIQIAVRTYKGEDTVAPNAADNCATAGNEPYRFNYNAAGKDRWVDYTLYSFTANADGTATITIPANEFIGFIAVK